MSNIREDWEAQVRLLGPRQAIIFGSGMQAVPEGWIGKARIGQEEITGLEKSHIPGHKGTISLGYCDECPILIIHGRNHAYEGYSKSQVCNLIREVASWGVLKILLFNATGGLDPKLSPGDLLESTHLWDANGPNWNVCKGKVPWVEVSCKKSLAGVGKGRYAMVSGPAYETAAEVRALGSLGAQLVGMSSFWEIQEGMRLGVSMKLVSVVANMGTGLNRSPLTHHDVCQVMSQSEKKITKVARDWLFR